ncbi:hypothetical protein ORI20_01655 [Mycobacterium sp. CVI_P3]|uniref:Prepilin peptidase n=1 Tax=Mycobacterium pinniadriaticum TaxID=2994102 RepID=A0ABT3S6P3_9MYCO|nr:hypothetical protein [Mycobacterium pinniadriaticum]MCX2928962.1 hypothetical protein [Mycobacterium pinniadriaticum]MCX2935171.1 hypothetical protein [Mycobacterium pinniadriaticum]
MSGVAVLLIAVGCADIVRRLATRSWPGVITGPVVAVATAALCGLWHPGDLRLVGSFASWIVALGGLALTATAEVPDSPPVDFAGVIACPS